MGKRCLSAVFAEKGKNTTYCDGKKFRKKVEKISKKHLIFGLTYGIILKYAVIIWRETCDDAGGGPS